MDNPCLCRCVVRTCRATAQQVVPTLRRRVHSTRSADADAALNPRLIPGKFMLLQLKLTMQLPHLVGLPLRTIWRRSHILRLAQVGDLLLESANLKLQTRNRACSTRPGLLSRTLTLARGLRSPRTDEVGDPVSHIAQHRVTPRLSLGIRSAVYAVYPLTDHSARRTLPKRREPVRVEVLHHERCPLAGCRLPISNWTMDEKPYCYLITERRIRSNNDTGSPSGS